MMWGFGLLAIAGGVILVIYAMQDLWPIAPVKLPPHPGEPAPPRPHPGGEPRMPEGA